MEINPMMYRVFLLDEKDAPGSIERPENNFRIRSGEKLAWCHTNPSWNPTIEEQLRSMNFGSNVGPSVEPLDGRWLIYHDAAVLGLVDSFEKIPERSYILAKREAKELADFLTKRDDKPYEFVDLTSRGDKSLAERLAGKINKMYVC
jgi:hypothetical protein